MNQKTTLAAGCLSAALLCAPAQANDFDGRWYFGLGAGVSQLEPDTSASDYDLDETQGTAGRLIVGRDLSNRLSLEFYYADLGELTLMPKATAVNPVVDPAISFQVAGAHLLVYLYNSDGADGRHYRDNFAAFVKVGLGAMETDSNVPYSQENDVLFNYGIGVEGLIGSGISWRGEVETFDTNTMLGSLTLLKRFGGAPSSPSAAVPAKEMPVAVEETVIAQATDIKPMENTEQLVEEEMPVLSTEPDLSSDTSLEAVVSQLETTTAESVSASMSNDNDGDGVVDADDRCPATASGLAVDPRGCSFSGIVEGLYFDRGSWLLSNSAKSILENVVLELRRFPNVVLEVQAHTDNRGSAADNLSLSQRRAESVANYMIDSGISSDRVRARGFGESRPAFRNASEEGRRRNRRVVFQTVEKIR